MTLVIGVALPAAVMGLMYDAWRDPRPVVVQDRPSLFDAARNPGVIQAPAPEPGPEHQTSLADATLAIDGVCSVYERLLGGGGVGYTFGVAAAGQCVGVAAGEQKADGGGELVRLRSSDRIGSIGRRAAPRRAHRQTRIGRDGDVGIII